MDEASPIDPLRPLAELTDLAATRDPALREARSRVDAADALARAIASETRPDLALTATLLGAGRRGDAVDRFHLEPVRSPPTVPNWDVGLVLRWQLFDPVVAARARAAAARADVARADLSVLVQQQAASLQQAYVALEVALAALSSLERAVDASHANYAQAEARFKAGLGTSLELADAESVRTDAEIQLAVGQFEAHRSRAVVGTPDRGGFVKDRSNGDGFRWATLAFASGDGGDGGRGRLGRLPGVARRLSREQDRARRPTEGRHGRRRARRLATARRGATSARSSRGSRPESDRSSSSAYVDTVLVRPGDVVKRGQVLATLDCRNASASSKAVAMQARALEAEQEAIAHESARVAELNEGGFASPNEIEKHAAESASKAGAAAGDPGAGCSGPRWR